MQVERASNSMKRGQLSCLLLVLQILGLGKRSEGLKPFCQENQWVEGKRGNIPSSFTPWRSLQSPQAPSSETPPEERLLFFGTRKETHKTPWNLPDTWYLCLQTCCFSSRHSWNLYQTLGPLPPFSQLNTWKHLLAVYKFIMYIRLLLQYSTKRMEEKKILPNIKNKSRRKTHTHLKTQQKKEKINPKHEVPAAYLLDWLLSASGRKEFLPLGLVFSDSRLVIFSGVLFDVVSGVLCLLFGACFNVLSVFVEVV